MFHARPAALLAALLRRLYGIVQRRPLDAAEDAKELCLLPPIFLVYFLNPPGRYHLGRLLGAEIFTMPARGLALKVTTPGYGLIPRLPKEFVIHSL